MQQPTPQRQPDSRYRPIYRSPEKKMSPGQVGSAGTTYQGYSGTSGATGTSGTSGYSGYSGA